MIFECSLLLELPIDSLDSLSFRFRELTLEQQQQPASFCIGCSCARYSDLRFLGRDGSVWETVIHCGHRTLLFDCCVEWLLVSHLLRRLVSLFRGFADFVPSFVNR